MEEIKTYNTLGAFLRNEFTNMRGKPRLAITPLMLALYDMRSQLRYEVYAKEWKTHFTSTKITNNMASKLKMDKTIMIIYLPLIGISMVFIEMGTEITVIPCSCQFIFSEIDYDPASIYFYRVMINNNNPIVTAKCRYRFDINDILEPAGKNISYSYLVASYVDMLENILSDVDQEYNLTYLIANDNNYDE